MQKCMKEKLGDLERDQRQKTGDGRKLVIHQEDLMEKISKMEENNDQCTNGKE